jgi:hypothetical protein
MQANGRNRAWQRDADFVHRGVRIGDAAEAGGVVEDAPGVDDAGQDVGISSGM